MSVRTCPGVGRARMDPDDPLPAEYSNYISDVEDLFADEPIAIFDDSDISKRYGKKFEDLDEVLETPNVLVDKSRFNVELTAEEINILALLMKQGWVQRQVTSIENTRMKYSGSDFKMTSQANHLAKLLTLLTESRRDSFHM